MLWYAQATGKPWSGNYRGGPCDARDGRPPFPPGFFTMGSAVDFETAFSMWRRMVMRSGYSDRKLAEARAAARQENEENESESE
jgi:hypothetical protein